MSNRAIAHRLGVSEKAIRKLILYDCIFVVISAMLSFVPSFGRPLSHTLHRSGTSHRAASSDIGRF